MKKASISELKNNLSAYLRRVEAGETVLVLDRDRPVARIDRVTDEAVGDDTVRIRRLQREGLLRPPLEPLSVDELRHARSAPPAGVLDALLDERAGGR